MGRQLNESTEDGRRAWDIPTIGLFTLVRSSGLIGPPLFGYIHGYTKRDCAFGDPLSHQRARHYRWGFHCRGARRSCRYESVS
jgi:hypothetical protein